jgi:capsular polysaccharide transport system ATP-binding protein
MIRLENICKSYRLHGHHKMVLDNVNQVFTTDKSVGLLGRNGAGKSTLLDIIGGMVDPTSGRVHRTGNISYPVGFAGSFHQDLTGAQNTRFVARIYGMDTDELIDFVADFSELGKQFHQPFRTYSSGMRARLSFGVSMGIPFDIYLIDEVTSVGDGAFRQKSIDMFAERRKTAGSIMVSHSPSLIRNVCDAGAVLEGGHMYYYDDLEEAIEHHDYNMSLERPD